MSNNLPIVVKEISKRENCLSVEMNEENKSDEIKIIKIYGKKKISEDDQERYKHCLEKLKQFSLPHICKIEDVKDDGSNIMIIMSKYSNSLENINPVEYFKESGIEEILKVICEFVSAFHVNDLIYGNLKPSNILLDEENNYYLSDYFCNILTRNMKMETNDITYLSPEIILNEEISEKSDIWSIGCLIYYLLSGKKIFEGETTNEIKLKILRSEYKELDCEFHEILNPLIRKLLKIKPKERMCIKELKEEIDKIQSNIYLPAILCNSKYIETKEKGDECFEIKEYSKAIEYYSECMKYVSNDEERCLINYFIGLSYYFLKEYSEAIQSLKEALKYSSSIDDNAKCKIYGSIGISYYFLKEYSEAIESLQEALKYSSESNDIIKCDIHRFIGISYYFLKEYSDAIQSLQESLKYSSKVSDNAKCEIHRFIGISYYFLKQYFEAINSLQESLKYSSQISDNIKCEIHRFIGKSYYSLKEYSEALKSLQEVLKYDNGSNKEEINNYINKCK